MYLAMDGIWIEFRIAYFLMYRGKFVILLRVEDWTESNLDHLKFDVLEDQKGLA